MDQLWMEMECWVDVLNEVELSGDFSKEVWVSFLREGSIGPGGFGVLEKSFDGEVLGFETGSNATGETVKHDRLTAVTCLRGLRGKGKHPQEH